VRAAINTRAYSAAPPRFMAFSARIVNAVCLKGTGHNYSAWPRDSDQWKFWKPQFGRYATPATTDSSARGFAVIAQLDSIFREPVLNGERTRSRYEPGAAPSVFLRVAIRGYSFHGSTGPRRVRLRPPI
jgi:hypothetical protein